LVAFVPQGGTNIWTGSWTQCLKNDTDVAHYNFDAGQPIFIILLFIIISLFNLSCLFAITSLICCEMRKAEMKKFGV